MEYNINKLAQIAHVSARTLRYYDQIGLLSPARISNGYRIYGKKEVDLLQQILIYRELGVPLSEIKNIVGSKNYDGTAALYEHLETLKEKKQQIDDLIKNVEKTIAASKGEVNMSDKEKFDGFKKKLVEENEQKYGKEIREKYGEEAVNASNTRLMGMTKEQYNEVNGLSVSINEKLKQAVLEGDPSSELAQEVCELHKKWLCYYWNEYSKEAHLSLGQMYVDDPRFKKYYDDTVEGGAEFLRDALVIYCK